MSQKREAKTRIIRIALAGNPNVGKSVVFNNLTKGRQRIGNWPGKTVEKKEGYFKYRGYKVEIIDLPGIYTLSTLSVEEKIARDYIIHGKPHVIVCIVDASIIERSLYLAIELAELDVPIIIFLNKMDLARRKGYIIDVEKLRRKLNVPIIHGVAIKGVGMRELCENIIEAYKKPRRLKITYGRILEESISRVVRMLAKFKVGEGLYNLRWLAVKLLEKDPEALEIVSKSKGQDAILKAVSEERSRIKKILGESPEVLLPEIRMKLVKEMVADCIVKVKPKRTFTEIIDRIALNDYIGPLLFIAVLASIYVITFKLTSPLIDMLENLFEHLKGYVTNALGEGIATSFINEGLLEGFGIVLSFVPAIFMLYFLLAFLEDSGYMARIAYLGEKLFGTLRLPGRALIPYMLGLGCNVPAVLACRTIPEESDRVTTALSVPFIPCAARLPVLMLMSYMILREKGVYLIVGIYLTLFLLAVISIRVLKIILGFKRESPFIIELPDYTMPSLRALVIHMWNHSVHFIVKAGTIILFGTSLLWFLQKAPFTAPLEAKYITIISKHITFLFKPLGFTWQLTASLIMGFIAKEVILSALEMLSGGEPSRLFIDLSRGEMLAYTFFASAYMPCLATIATLIKEYGWRRGILAIVWNLSVAYLLSLIIKLVFSHI